MTKQISLLDTVGAKTREWYVLYHDRVPFFRFTKYLKPGFRHVELAKPIQIGPGIDDVLWLHLLPTFEMLDVELSFDPTPPWVRCPQSVIQRVTATRPYYRVRQWFHIGPVSCVETAKNALGINAFWVRTPWQLYRYINRRGGVINSR